jgi:hypothetical protein
VRQIIATVTSVWVPLILAATLASAPALARLPDGLTLDHGYTYFELEGETEAIDGNMVDQGWKMKPHLRIWGDAPERSSIKIVIRDGRKVLAERRANTTVYGEGHPVLQISVGNTIAGLMQPHLFVAGGVQGILSPVEGTGEFDVDISYIDGDTEKEYEAHTYTINVAKADVLDSTAGKLKVRPPNYFVSRHQELLSTILTPWSAYQGGSGGMGDTYKLLWNASPLETGGNPTSNDAYLRCTVDGEPIAFGNPEDPQRDQLQGLDGTNTTDSYKNRFISEMHSDRNALEYRSGTAYRERINFFNYLTRIPFDDASDNYPPNSDYGVTRWAQLEKHPGDWECRWLDNGELIRTFRWEVSDDGKLVPHEEQEEGLTLNPGAILVETIIPEGGASFDGRIVPDAVQDGGFYGWEWESRSMRRLAGDLEEKGTAWPVPSAAEFVPEPDKGPSAQQLAKERREADAAAAAAERKAEQEDREARLKADREQYASEDEARLAENERVRQEAMEKEMARTQEELAKTLGEAQAGIEAAQEKIEQQTRGSSGIYMLARLLLSVLLILCGLVMAGGQIAALESVHKAITPHAATIGIATVGVALFDLLLDLAILRPIVGDGLAQLVGLAAGGILAKETVDGLTAGKLTSVLASLEGQMTNVGFAAFAMGVIHLLFGGASLI